MRVAMAKLVHRLLEKLKEDNMENDTPENVTEDHLRADEDAPQMSASVQTTSNFKLHLEWKGGKIHKRLERIDSQRS